MASRPAIVYFSGTGNTAYVARQFGRSFSGLGSEPSLIPLEVRRGPAASGMPDNGVDERAGAAAWGIPLDADFMLIVFPVHDFDAPLPLFEFVDGLEAGHGLKTAVVSVSGGGDMVSNRASRVRVAKRLERKGFPVVYEAMLMMPSNSFYATPPLAASALLRVLPEKCETITGHLQSGFVLRPRVPLVDRFLSLVGVYMRRSGVLPKFGKDISADASCTGCGWCADSCPRGNIAMQGVTPLFGANCVMCLRCLYGCPQKALHAGYFPSALLKGGYSLGDMIRYAERDAEPDKDALRKELRGFLWKGAREYLGL